MGTHAVKVKTKDSKRYEFLTPSGGLTHLRFHAATADKERCEAYAKDILDSNPEIVESVKVVTFMKEG